jgi:hypothetical protein
MFQCIILLISQRHIDISIRVFSLHMAAPIKNGSMTLGKGSLFVAFHISFCRFPAKTNFGTFQKSPCPPVH